jgi:hypothetical protein
MATNYDQRLLTPPTKPGIDENNPTQVRLVREQQEMLLVHLRQQVKGLTEELKREIAVGHPLLLLERELGKNGENDDSGAAPLETSLRELAELFASKYPDEEHPRVQSLIRMFTRPIEDKMEGADEVSPVVPPIR